MRRKIVTLDQILAREIRNNDFRIAFDEHRFYLQIAHLISDLRKKAGISQAALAKKSGMSQPMIARLEKGDYQRTPTFETIHRLLKVLGYKILVQVQREKTANAA